MDNIKTRINIEYRISPEKFKEKFPQIEGHIKRIVYDNRDNTIVIDSEYGYYLDDQIKIWKELGDTEDKNTFIASHLKTKISAEGKTEEEAKKNIIEKVKTHYDVEEKERKQIR